MKSKFLQKNSSTILTCIGTAGVIATSVTAVKATPKALHILESAKKEKGEELTNVEKIKATWKCYIPSVSIGVGTIACIFGANILNKKSQASLVSAYTLLDEAYKSYRDKVKDIYGEDADEKTMRELSESNSKLELFYDLYSNRYFESTMDKVLLAESEFNAEFILNNKVSVNDFYNKVGLDPIEDGDDLGWSLDPSHAFLEYYTIDFTHEPIATDNGKPCIMITFDEYPELEYIGF